MLAVDRTLADYRGTGITAGPQLMKHLREQLAAEGVMRACDLPRLRDGSWVKVAGLVIVRQRPGTAKGFCFLTLEDETGIANAVVVPDLFQRHRTIIHSAALLLVEGPLQKVPAGVPSQISGAETESRSDTRHPTPDAQYVVHVRARRFTPLQIPEQRIGMVGRGYRMRVAAEENPAPTPPPRDFK